MSGGSLDYMYSRVQDAADTIRARNPDSPLHQAFADHLDLVWRALHDCEWVMSCDYAEGEDEEAIRAVLAPGAELEAATRQAEKAADILRGVLGRVSPPDSAVDTEADDE